LRRSLSCGHTRPGRVNQLKSNRFAAANGVSRASLFKRRRDRTRHARARRRQFGMTLDTVIVATSETNGSVLAASRNSRQASLEPPEAAPGGAISAPPIRSKRARHSQGQCVHKLHKHQDERTDKCGEYKRRALLVIRVRGAS